MNTDKPILKKVYTAKTKLELMQAYGEWAEKYDSDLSEFGYAAPQEASAYFAKYVDKDAEVIDAGCGTGLVGNILSEMGYQTIDGLDYSVEMLNKAAEKRIYRNLMQADLTEEVEIDEDSYGGLICVGTFTYAHVDADAFESLIKIVKPGGIIVFTVREGAYDDLNYREKMVELEYHKKWELIEMSDGCYFSDDNVTCKLCVYKVL